MSWFPSNIRARLVVLLLALLLLMLGLGLSGLVRTETMRGALKSVHDDRMLPLAQLRSIGDAYAHRIIMLAREPVDVWAAPEDWQRLRRELATSRALINDQWRTYRSTSLTLIERQLANEVEAGMLGLEPLLQELDERLAQRDPSGVQYLTISRMAPRIETLVASLSRLVDLQLQVASADLVKAEQAFLEGRRLTVILLAAALILAGAGGGWIVMTLSHQVQQHHATLESRINERTAELVEVVLSSQQLHQKLQASIDYACMLQRALLPERELAAAPGLEHFVLWRPRDTVGGDFFFFREMGEHVLLGVADCAGHGVPGAMMAMLTHAALDRAVQEMGPQSPARVLGRTDALLRSMLCSTQLPRFVATSVDLGLVCLERGAKQLRFAGANSALYWSDHGAAERLAGARRPLCDRRPGEYADMEIPLVPGRSWYLASDGFFDQAGGENGFGFGNQRFLQLLRECATQSMTEQRAALADTLGRYSGEHPQRDDITVLGFRYDA